MPWNNNNGGGGWQGGGGGGGDRGPWGQGPRGGGGGGGNQPPDLDELLRRAQEKLRQVFGGAGGPGGGMGTATAGGGSGPVFLVGLVLLGLLAYSSFFRVNTDQQGIVLRFGQVVRTVEPGLHLKFPYPIETVYTPAVTRIETIAIGAAAQERLMLTGDENIVDIRFNVQWKIKAGQAADFLFNVENPENAVKAVSESVMREVVGQSEIEFLQTIGRSNVQVQVLQKVQETLDSYKAGIEITEVSISEVDPPAEVIDAYRDVQAARTDRERLQNQAETYANTVVPRARGDAARITQAAEAYREQIVAAAEGDANRFLAIYNEYRKAQDVTRKRIYLETMQHVIGDANKLFLSDPNSGKGILPYLPLNELQPRAGSSPSQTSETPSNGNQTATGGR
ncbi:FtsH protease activity modulator HflK [Parvibaculum sp.]|jgi:membrane protease subunit HflK|uniref:FtsH protease activity modulator HflK n=1 Tax=Parvibaculum sp. TaxID=2024848 RepID=UPI002A2F428C|nr:FtsH protease activity modulator HflK [Parvibaculum sp.]